MIVAYYRGYVTKEQKLAGGMAAIGLSANATSTFLRDGVVIACENSPSSTTISGDIRELEEVMKQIKEERPDILTRQLKVDMAYHSRQYHSRRKFRNTDMSHIRSFKDSRWTISQAHPG